ncbi:hypothetical protein M2451_002363 [Dysgonomonas sp. PFB1-18]|uniref:hypothetical protein n=1 Tax=unclassified Dysgonomonas TaxID=2630389 RepID=UPI002475B2E1|nr:MULTISPECIES: hypothetical protein [unclassified Dysgonomonas]MDH6307129.1 hypothetical protein [Dysgonomonas sp. PF1-14]MDH6337048.1 hypothetical protein [Dysgonomonas sp. PF1-16]MDH6381034.1 hypothetical protein [Dysgonomonas sp. PFB1-18]MDH6396387.1 hypothetical protein [Dysgonomonas sp. PF1-23]
MIIKKLLNKNDYAEYSNRMVDVWTENAMKYPQHFKDYDKLVADLKKVLDQK